MKDKQGSGDEKASRYQRTGERIAGPEIRIGNKSQAEEEKEGD